MLIVFLKTRISGIRGNNKDQFLKKQKVMVFPHLVTAEVPAAPGCCKFTLVQKANCKQREQKKLWGEFQ